MKRSLDNKIVTIYTLTHPITGLIFYVGQTTMPLRQRLICHWTVKAKMSDRYEIIMNDLRLKGIRPTIEPVDTCEYSKKRDIECFWVQTISGWGFDLVNYRHNSNKSYIAPYDRKKQRDLRHRVVDDFYRYFISELYGKDDVKIISKKVGCSEERIRQVVYSIKNETSNKIIAWLYDPIVEYYTKKAENIYNLYQQKIQYDNSKAVC